MGKWRSRDQSNHGITRRNVTNTQIDVLQLIFDYFSYFSYFLSTFCPEFVLIPVDLDRRSYDTMAFFFLSYE